MLKGAGLDRGSVRALHKTVVDLEAFLKEEKPPWDHGEAGEAEKKDKSGMLAVSLLKRLTTILTLMYDASAQDPIGPSAASSFRLALTRWKERHKRGFRCATAPELHC